MKESTEAKAEKKKTTVKCVEWFDQHFYRVEYEREVLSDEGIATMETVVDYLPSVTTKLGVIDKPFLKQWYGDLGAREANLRMMEAQERGSRIHSAWEVFTTGGAVVFNSFKVPAYTNQEIMDLESKYNRVCVLHTQEEMFEMTKLEKLYAYLKPQNIVSESTLWDLEMRDAGTMDNYFQLAEDVTIKLGTKPLTIKAGGYVFDLKTGNSIGDGRVQVAAYAVIARKMGFEVSGGIICHTGSKSRSGDIPGLSLEVLEEADIQSGYEEYRLAAQLWERRNGNMKPKILEIPTLIAKEIAQ